LPKKKKRKKKEKKIKEKLKKKIFAYAIALFRLSEAGS